MSYDGQTARKPKKLYLVYCSYPYSDNPKERTNQIKVWAQRILEQFDDLVLLIPHFVFDAVWADVKGNLPKGYEHTKIAEQEFELIKRCDIFTYAPEQMSSGVIWEKSFASRIGKPIFTFSELMQGLRPRKPLTADDAKLIAWSIAWEGSIALHTNRATPTRIIPKIYIRNTELELLQKFHELVGGSIYLARDQIPERNFNRLWELRISGSRAVGSLLSQILPYIPSRKKEKIAKLVLQFCEIRTYCKYNQPYTKKEFQIQKEVKELNVRKLEELKNGKRN